MTVDEIISFLGSDPKRKTATYYIEPKKVIRVTRRHKPNKRATRNEYVVTIGAPNYLATKFIKLAKKAKEPFPINRLQFDMWPVKRKK